MKLNQTVKWKEAPPQNREFSIYRIPDFGQETVQKNWFLIREEISYRTCQENLQRYGVEGLAPLGIMGAQIRAPVKPLQYHTAVWYRGV